MYIALRKIYTLCKFYIYVYDACVINKVLIYMVDDNATACTASSISIYLTILYVKRTSEYCLDIFFLFKLMLQLYALSFFFFFFFGKHFLQIV